jgi:Bacterial TniB protein
MKTATQIVPESLPSDEAETADQMALDTDTSPAATRYALGASASGDVVVVSGQGPDANTFLHLDPAIRPIAIQDNLTRAQHVLKDVYLNHPHAQAVERQIEQLIRLPRKIRMPGLFLCAESGIGKTQILRRIERRHPVHEDGTRRCRPVLYVQVPAAPTVRSLRRTLLDEAEIPFLDYPNKPTPESLLRRGLAAAHTRLIMLDEIHNIEHMKYTTRTLLRDYVRCLSNSTQLPIVLGGTSEFEQALTEDRQLESRYPIMRLPRWTDRPEFMAFLQGYERACPLRLPSRLTEPQFVRAILAETHGITDSIIRSLQAAALVAIRVGTERIGLEDLAWWRDPPAFQGIDQASELASESELARAWLNDTRRSANPPSGLEPRQSRNRARIQGEGKI